MKFFQNFAPQFPEKERESRHELHQLAPMRIISDHGLHGWTRIDTKVDRVLPNAMSAGPAIALGTRRSTRFNASLARRSLGEGGNAATSAKPQTISLATTTAAA
jgi:hypothetical protein